MRFAWRKITLGDLGKITSSVHSVLQRWWARIASYRINGKRSSVIPLLKLAVASFETSKELMTCLRGKNDLSNKII